MKVMIVVGSFKTGGAERMAINAGQELINHGIDVHFVLQRPIFELQHSIDQGRIHIIHPRPLRSKYLFHFLSIVRIFLIHRRLRPGLVLAFTYFSSFLACFTFARRVIGRFDIDPYSFKSKKRDRLANVVAYWPRVIRIILPSQGLADSLAKRNSRLREKVMVIPNSINVESILALSRVDIADIGMAPPFGGGPFIAAMGRLTHQKNYELLISAYARSRIQQKMGLVIIGDGTLMVALQQAIARNGVTDRVLMTGALRNPFPIVRAARLFVNTSNFESFCNVILEALTLSVPVVATDCPFGPSEIVKHNHSGILIPVNDREALIHVFDELSDNEDLLNRLRQNSAQSVGRFEVPAIGLKWLNVVNEFYKDNAR